MFQRLSSTSVGLKGIPRLLADQGAVLQQEVDAMENVPCCCKNQNKQDAATNPNAHMYVNGTDVETHGTFPQ